MRGLPAVLVFASVSIAMTVIPAAAACVLGMGDSCPIGDSEARRLLRPEIDGKLTGRYVLQAAISAGQIYERHPNPNVLAQGPEIIRTARAAHNIIDGSGDCSALDAVLKGAYNTSHVPFCRLARVMKARGFATIEVGQRQSEFATRNVVIYLKPTARSQSAAQGLILQNRGDETTFATGRLSFVRIARSIAQNQMGEMAATVEFEYDIVPTVWAHVEKGLLRDGLPSMRRTGTAIFRKWSDGWHLAARPEL
ncbi:MAG: hypothetical protein F9K38_15185 [Pseudorhodoplanes sp.]|nr:MAG: hypothetical protein F9K38_15185 [Pseudorhodoplanes sp.]